MSKRLIAWSMTLGRLLFAPLLLWQVLTGRDGWTIAACILTEVLLDVFDGIVARRLKVATSRLRRTDSLVDTVFYLAVLYCAWAKHATAVKERWWMLSLLLGMEALRYGFDYWKFRRESAYHMWSSKAWGLLLGAAVIALLAFNMAGWLLSAALLFGVLCDLEGLLISALLHQSVEDIPHLLRAMRIRREQEQRMQAVGKTAAAR